MVMVWVTAKRAEGLAGPANTGKRDDPLSIIRHRIQEVLGMYARACGMSQRQGG
jgi:hypothetical protein